MKSYIETIIFLLNSWEFPLMLLTATVLFWLLVMPLHDDNK